MATPAAAKTKVEAWTELIHAFLQGRANLRAGLSADRRPPRPQGRSTTPCSTTLDKAAVNYQVVLTKADQVKPADLAARIAATKAALARHPAAFPK